MAGPRHSSRSFREVSRVRTLEPQGAAIAAVTRDFPVHSQLVGLDSLFKQSLVTESWVESILLDVKPSLRSPFFIFSPSDGSQIAEFSS